MEALFWTGAGEFRESKRGDNAGEFYAARNLHIRAERGRRSPRSRVRRDDCECAERFTNSDSVTNSNGYANSGTNSIRDSLTDTHSNSNSDRNGNGYSDTHTNDNAHSDADRNANAKQYSVSKADDYRFSFPDQRDRRK